MRRLKKFLCLVIFMIMLTNFFTAFSYEVQALDYSEMVSQSTAFINAGKGKASSISIGDITAEFVPLGQILTMIGAGVMVAITTYMGIKYLTSGPDAQAKLKQQLIGVVVSGVVIFGAYGIWATVLRIVENFD